MTVPYDFALTFAGENRAYVQRVASALKERGYAVFFDEDEEADMWGRHLTEHLPDVYNSRARYCIMFISQHYAKKTWPNLERQSAIDRARQQPGSPYLLPVKLDDTELPGILGSVAYIDGRRKTPEQIADLAARKAGAPTSPSSHRAVVRENRDGSAPEKPAILRADLIDPICAEGDGPHEVDSRVTELRLLVSAGEVIVGLIREIDNENFEFEIVDAENLAERFGSADVYAVELDGSNRGTYAINWQVPHDGPWYLLLSAPRARRIREVELELERRRRPRSISELL